MTIEVLGKDEIQFAGEYGKGQLYHERATFAAEAIAGVAQVMKIKAGTKVFGARAINAALGASTTLSMGFTPVRASDGPAADAAYFKTATSTSSAGVILANGFVPITFDFDVYLTLTVGGGAATGIVDVIVESTYVGTK